MIDSESSKATVESVGAGVLTVRMDCGHSCGGCALSRTCGMGRDADTVTVAVRDSSLYSVGDRLAVSATAPSSARAVVLCLVVPCVLLVAGVWIGMAFGQIAGALAGLGAVGLWFALLYALRRRLAGIIEWKVKKLDNE